MRGRAGDEVRRAREGDVRGSQDAGNGEPERAVGAEELKAIAPAVGHAQAQAGVGEHLGPAGSIRTNWGCPAARRRRHFCSESRRPRPVAAPAGTGMSRRTRPSPYWPKPGEVEPRLNLWPALSVRVNFALALHNGLGTK